MKINKLVGFILSTILLNNVVESMENVYEFNNKPSKLEIEQNNLEVRLATQESELEYKIKEFTKTIDYNYNINKSYIDNFINNIFHDYIKNRNSFFNDTSIIKLCDKYDKNSCGAIHIKFYSINAVKAEEAFELIKSIMKTKLEIYNTNNELDNIKRKIENEWNNIKSEIEIKRIQREEEKQKELEELQKKNLQALENKQKQIDKISEEIGNINKQIKDLNGKVDENKANIFNVLFGKVERESSINQIMGNLDAILVAMEGLIINYVPNKKYDPSFKGSAKEAWNNFTDKKFWKDTWNDVTGNKKNNNQNNNINCNNNDLRNALCENSCIELYDDKIIENMKNIIMFKKNLDRLQSKLGPLESKLKELKEK